MKTLLTLILFFTCTANIHAQENVREFEMKEGDTTYVMKKYIMCFLKKGPNREQNEQEAQKIQEGHMAHLNKLAEAGKIAIAGPFEDDSDVSGIVIFDVATVEEAKQLEADDPAVLAGRLTMEFHPWWAAKGSTLP